MVEVFSFIGILAVIFLSFTFSKFLGFRKRLMAAFARRGVPYSIANDAYSRAADVINTMNADGKSADEIVEMMLLRFPEYFE